MKKINQIEPSISLRDKNAISKYLNGNGWITENKVSKLNNDEILKLWNDKEKYREKYCLNTASSYLVDESFPALNRTNTDAAIKNVRYNIELGDLTPCRNSIDEIVDIVLKV